MSEVYKELIVETKINKIKVPVKVTIKIEEDDVPFDGDDARDIRRHKNGELFNAIIFVKAEVFNLEGFDSLGSCSVRSNNAYNSEPFETDVESFLKEYKLVKNAIQDLVKTIKSQAKLLKPFMKGK